MTQTHQPFNHPGERLSHILDIVNFTQRRGKYKEFHELLTEANPEIFGNLTYSTVKTWFHGHVPHIKKASHVLACIVEKYPLPADFDLVLNWWKLGGPYPFNSDHGIAGITSGKTVIAVGELYLRTHRISEKLNMNLSDKTLFPTPALERIFEAILTYQKNNPSATEAEVDAVISSLICLTKNRLLNPC